jgi:excisionase family DNA binding protein
METLMTPQQLAEYLEVPLATVYRWRYHDDGPVGFRVGRHVRYRRADVEAWLEARLNEGRNATSVDDSFKGEGPNGSGGRAITRSVPLSERRKRS